MAQQYQTGTVTVTNGSATVTGVGTQWLSEGISSGDAFVVRQRIGLYFVGSVVSNTQLTLTAPYGEADGSGLDYGITRDFTPQGIPLMGPGSVGAAPTFNEAVVKLEALATEAIGIAGTVAGIYVSTAAGIAATSNGEYFFVAASGAKILTLYRNVSTVATFINDYPSSTYVEILRDQAAASATTSVNARDDLLNRYYGALSGEPSTRPNGSASQSGDLYYNTSSDSFFVYDGSDWLLMTIPTGDVGTASVRNVGAADAELPTNELIRQNYDVEPRITVKPTIDLDFRNNDYTVWQDDENSFTKQPLADAITITNGGGTLIRPTGIIGSVGANVGRLTTVAGRQGLLVEEARTNAVANSGKLDESNWVKVGFDVENDNDLVETSGDSDKRLTNVSPTHLLSGVVGVTAYRIGSVSGMSGRYLILSIGNTTTGGSNRYGIVVDPNTGEVTNSFGIGSTTLSGFGAYRTPDGGLFLWVAGSRNDSDLRNYSLAITTSPSSTTVPSVTGAGARLNDVRVQIEAGSTPSSYIPTTTAAVTRVADNVVRELGDEFNPREGTLIVAFQFSSLSFTSVQPIFGVYSTENAGRIIFQTVSGTPTAFAQHERESSGGSSGRGSSSGLLEGLNIAALTFKQNPDGTYNIKSCINGLMRTARLNRSFDLSSAELRWARGSVAGSGFPDLRPSSPIIFAKSKYVPAELPDAQLIAMTKGAN